MKNQIKNVMSAVFEMNPGDILDSDTSSTIESWDSLNHMNLIVALEEEFNIRFEDEEIVELTSFVKIEELISSKI